MPRDPSFRLLQETYKAIDKLGINGTIKALQAAQFITGDQMEKVENFIIDHVCKCSGMERSDFFDGSGYGLRTHAFMFACVLYRNHLGYTQATIGKKLGKDKTTISRRIKTFNGLDQKNKHDNVIITLYNEINSGVLQYIETLKNDNDGTENPEPQD